MSIQEITLEDRLNAEFCELEVAEEHQTSIRDFLRILQRKHSPTYEHSVRVGLLATRIAKHMHVDPKALLFAGTLHDIGKLLVRVETLEKTGGLDETDWKELKHHPEYTYRILRDIHQFSAEIALRHHYWQERGYPDRLPRSKAGFSRSTKMQINYFARLLALADFYDAASTRVNDKFGERRKLSPEEVKEIMYAKNTDISYILEDLYKNRILGEDLEMPVTSKQEDIYQQIWKDFRGIRNPRETRRHVVLASALEPIAEKTGCTTRSRDISPWLKLDYFIAGAINIGDSFEDLADRLLQAQTQPSLVYDLAYKAQEQCARNRAGGRINQGIIEILFPIVSAEMLFDREYKLSPEEVLKMTKGFMQNTTPEDVSELVKMKRLAYDLCAYHDREVCVHPHTRNVYQYYQMDLGYSRDNLTSQKHNEEFVLGFPTVLQIYHLIRDSRRKIFDRKIEDAYAMVRAGNHRGVGEGLTADCIAAGIYLTLSHHPTEQIIM